MIASFNAAWMLVGRRRWLHRRFRQSVA